MGTTVLRGGDRQPACTLPCCPSCSSPLGLLLQHRAAAASRHPLCLLRSFQPAARRGGLEQGSTSYH